MTFALISQYVNRLDFGGGLVGFLCKAQQIPSAVPPLFLSLGFSLVTILEKPCSRFGPVLCLCPTPNTGPVSQPTSKSPSCLSSNSCNGLTSQISSLPLLLASPSYWPQYFLSLFSSTSKYPEILFNAHVYCVCCRCILPHLPFPWVENAFFAIGTTTSAPRWLLLFKVSQ